MLSKRGVSEMAVRKAIVSGRISVEEDGTIEPRADAQWGRQTDPAKQRGCMRRRWARGPSLALSTASLPLIAHNAARRVECLLRRVLPCGVGQARATAMGRLCRAARSPGLQQAAPPHDRFEPLSDGRSDDFTLCGSPGIPSVRGSGWLNEQKMRFLTGEWTMFDTFRDHKHLSSFQSDGPVPELDVDFT